MKAIHRTTIFFISLFLLLGCKETKKVKKEILRPIKYQQIGFSKTDLIRTFSGTAKTDKEIKLSFRNSGIITKFSLKLGKKVRKGELLAELDNVQARLAYQKALTSLNSAKSQKNTAKLNLDRIRLLYEKGSVSLSEFERDKNAYVGAKDSYSSAQKNVSLQRDQLNYGMIYAPETGIIALVDAEINENVTKGQVVGVLNAGKRMEVSLGIPEGVINSIVKGMGVSVSFTSLKNEKFVGNVIEVSPSLDLNTATYLIKVDVLDTKNKVKSGMAAEVTFNFKSSMTDKSQLIVPVSAVGEDSNGRFVFLVTTKDGKTGVVTKQKVIIGKLSSLGFEIVSGLKAGQKIAIAGLQTLLDGQKVKLQ